MSRQSEHGEVATPCTLTACVRCRQRKTRCDAGLPCCGPCERSESLCHFWDSSKKRTISRAYVVFLQRKVKNLERDLAQLDLQQHTKLDVESMIRSAGVIRLKDNDEGRYLGPSSGIAMTRLNMEFAKQVLRTKSIKEVVPPLHARQIKEHFTQESSKPTSKIYPLISDIAAPSLPSKELTHKLIENFNETAQYLLPTLHEPTLDANMEEVYNGSTDAYKNFTLRMVISVSMQKLDSQYAGLADSYYLAALPYLDHAIKPMNLGTLQCFALIAQYSMLTPTRTAAYWIVGLATKLCQELGFTEEDTIAHSSDGQALSVTDIDMRRRLYWVTLSMELGLAHSLGRPNSFGTTFDHIDVGFFSDVDDKYITKHGIIPGSPSSIKKRVSLHFFKMRLCQLEIRQKLYLKRIEESLQLWFSSMDQKLKDWLSARPPTQEGSGLDGVWFTARYYTMVIFLHRPSPQIPQPSLESARICMDAATFTIRTQRSQIAKESVDVTWIFTQTLFMGLNTLLWALTYPEIRRERSKAEIEDCVHVARSGLVLAAERWPGVEAAMALYDRLVKACIKAYDGDEGEFYVVDRPRDQVSLGEDTSCISNAATSPSTVNNSMVKSPRGDPQFSLYTGDLDDSSSNVAKYTQVSSTQANPTSSDTSDIAPLGPVRRSGPHSRHSVRDPSDYKEQRYDPSSAFNSLPALPERSQIWNLFPPAPDASVEALLGTSTAYDVFSPNDGNCYSHYLQGTYLPQEPVHCLSSEQRSELMNNLEKNGLSSFVSPSSIIHCSSDMT